MNTISDTFYVMAGIVVISWVLSRVMDGEPIFPEPDDLTDLEALLKYGVGFISIILLIAATGLLEYFFTGVYVRIATTLVMVVLIYAILRYRFRPSLLLIGLCATLLLFNPIMIVVMQRSQWIIVDIAVAVVLPLLVYRYVTYNKKRERKSVKAKSSNS